MEKNQEPNHFAKLTQEELKELENLEQRFGYTLVAYAEEPDTSHQGESSLK